MIGVVKELAFYQSSSPRLSHEIAYGCINRPHRLVPIPQSTTYLHGEQLFFRPHSIALTPSRENIRLPEHNWLIPSTRLGSPLVAKYVTTLISP